ncbi:MAG: hypothetical protein ABJN62_04800 [Halioglobus sp.]
MRWPVSQWGVFLALLLLASLCFATDSRYYKILDSLQSADSTTQGSFASIALLELMEVYFAEADLARNESGSSAERSKRIGWSRAVEQYSTQLSLVIDDIDSGMPVALHLHAREVAAVSVAGRTIMLAHPRSGQQQAYEQSVLTRFCIGDVCRDLVAATETHEPIPMSSATVTPHWDFGPSGPVCSHLNLSIEFDSGGKLALQKQLCQQFMQEVEVLSTEIAWQTKHGVDTQWYSLSIKPTPMKPEHLVLLNTAGDSLLISLPLLYGTKDALKKVTPWLRGRHASEGPPAVSLEANRLGWH